MYVFRHLKTLPRGLVYSACHKNHATQNERPYEETAKSEIFRLIRGVTQ